MSFKEFILEFFRITTNIKGEYPGPAHAIVASFITIAVIFCGVYFGLKLKDKDNKYKIKIIAIITCVLWALEIAYIFMPFARGKADEILKDRLPLYLCDIQFYALAVICIVKKDKVKNAAMGFVICLGMLAFVMGVWINGKDNYSNNPIWSSACIFAFLAHGLPGFVSIFIPVSGLYRLKFKECWQAMLIMLPIEIAALIVVYTVPGSNYMFFRHGSGTPFAFFKSVIPNQGAYSFVVFLMMNSYVVLFYGGWELVHFIIKKKTTNNVVVQTSSDQTTKVVPNKSNETKVKEEIKQVIKTPIKKKAVKPIKSKPTKTTKPQKKQSVKPVKSKEFQKKSIKKQPVKKVKSQPKKVAKKSK